MADDNQQDQEQLPPEPPTSDDIANLYPVPMTGALFKPPPPPAKQQKHSLFGGLFKRKPKIKHVKKIGKPQPAQTAPQPLLPPVQKTGPVVVTAPAVIPPSPHPVPEAPKLPMPEELVSPGSGSSLPVIVMPSTVHSDKDPKLPPPPKPDTPSQSPAAALQPPIDLQPGVIISPNKPRA